MKFTKLSAVIMAVSTATALAACSSSDDEKQSEPTTAASSKAPASEAAGEIPMAADLNAILAKATDPNVPTEEKVQTVQGSETATELFDVMTQSQAESGAVFEVVDPVIPGLVPDSALATVHITTPDGQVQTADQVEFVREDGNWKLSKTWACMLITNIVPPEEVPAMCADTAAGAETAAQNEGEAPAEGAPAEEAPAEGAPAEGAPAQ
ncbi:hypothetical protein [Corynebacterium sp.]|uniref:hypothetical protein n=1 Tax=Corynebacterium sp. TaxID=1720 RepID=UPI0026DB329C|nr:hypothetical protein [Corynebacterium sp.]MDO5031405.1 hypothetical protein [Corynebacterium sp.]